MKHDYPRPSPEIILANLRREAEFAAHFQDPALSTVINPDDDSINGVPLLVSTAPPRKRRGPLPTGDAMTVTERVRKHRAKLKEMKGADHSKPSNKRSLVPRTKHRLSRGK
jgi:hypothetical protein